MPSLPLELIDNVVAHLEDNDMPSFALTCRSYNEITRKRMLWKPRTFPRLKGLLAAIQGAIEKKPSHSLDPSTIRQLFIPLNGVDVIPDMLYNQRNTKLSSILQLLRCCTNLHGVAIPCNGSPLLRKHLPSIFNALVALPNLRSLDLGDMDLDVSALSLVATHILPRLMSLIFTMEGTTLGSMSFPLCALRHFSITCHDFSDEQYQTFSASFFPACRTMRLTLHGLMMPSSVARSLSLLNNNTLSSATLFHTMARSAQPATELPVLSDGPCSIVFAIHRATREDLFVTRWIEMGRRWDSGMFDRFEALLNWAGTVWIKRGQDMGYADERLVLDKAQTCGKTIVWL